jgi:hypothetical protein
MAKNPRNIDPKKHEGRQVIEELAHKALKAFSADAKKDYEHLVKAYDGCNAVVGIFGMGSVTVAVSKGEVHINPDPKQVPTKTIGRGATYAETLVALSQGELTALEAFHKGDLVARAESNELHKAYGFFVKFSDAALRSERLQHVLEEFRTKAGC